MNINIYSSSSALVQITLLQVDALISYSIFMFCRANRPSRIANTVGRFYTSRVSLAYLVILVRTYFAEVLIHVPPTALVAVVALLLL